MTTQVILKLDGWKPFFVLLENPANTMFPATTEALVYIHGRLTRYKSTSDPSQPPGSRYIRTFDLKHAQHYQQFGGYRILGRVYSKGVPYDRYVIAAATQASIHRRGRNEWYTYESTAEDELEEVAAIYDRFWQQKFQEL